MLINILFDLEVYNVIEFQQLSNRISKQVNIIR